MKKIIPFMAVAALAFSPLWAKERAKTASEIPDSYDEISSDEEIPSDEENLSDEGSGKEEDDPYSKEKLRPKNERNFGEKLFGLDRFQQVDRFSLFAKSSVGTLQLKKKASLIHREGTDIGGFYCYYDTSAYAVQFDRKARAALISAVNQYLDDFANKKLDRKAKQKRTESIYGTAEAYEEYGIATANLNHAARPKVCFGYEFIKGNPYFSIYAKKAKDLKYVKRSGDDIRIGETIPQRYYFTKAQATRLAEFLSDENIDSLCATTSYDEEVEMDEYSGE